MHCVGCSSRGLTNGLVYVAASGKRGRLDRIDELHWKSMQSKLLSLVSSMDCRGVELGYGSYLLLLPLSLCLCLCVCV